MHRYRLAAGCNPEAERCLCPRLGRRLAEIFEIGRRRRTSQTGVFTFFGLMPSVGRLSDQALVPGLVQDVPQDDHIDIHRARFLGPFQTGFDKAGDHGRRGMSKRTFRGIAAIQWTSE